MSNSYEELSDFILNQMRMSISINNVDRTPVQRSSASIPDSKALLSRDDSQVEYYEHITKNMVGKVLTKGRGITSRDKNQYSLIGFDGSLMKRKHN